MELSPLKDCSGGFEAEQRSWQIGPLALTWSSGEGVINRRDPASIRRDQLDHWAIILTRRGHFLYQNGQRLLLVNQSNLVLYGLQMPNLSERSDAEWIMAFIPRDALPEIAPKLRRAARPDAGYRARQVLRGHLDELAWQLPAMSVAEAPRAAEATLALTALPSPARPTTARRRGHRSRPCCAAGCWP